MTSRAPALAALSYLALLACLACLACTIAGCGPHHPVDGAIAGSTVAIEDQLSATLVDGSNQLAVLELTSVSGACAALTAGQKLKSAQTLTLTLSRDGALPVSPGDFPVSASGSSAGPAAVVRYEETDASCVVLSQVHGLHGTVTLTAVSGDGYTGSADVTLDTDDHITFSFATTACSALSDAAGPSTCP
jgi:hypothetical protein